jgi:hypothetical protein
MREGILDNINIYDNDYIIHKCFVVLHDLSYINQSMLQYQLSAVVH